MRLMSKTMEVPAERQAVGKAAGGSAQVWRGGQEEIGLLETYLGICGAGSPRR